MNIWTNVDDIVQIYEHVFTVLVMAYRSELMT
jgi:hypothetical protein